MKKFLAYLAIIMNVQAQAQAQVSYTSRPENLQIYPRNIETGKAIVLVSGVTTAADFVKARLEMFKESVLMISEEKVLSGTSGESFSFSTEIDAGLFNHKFIISLQNSAGNWGVNYVADNVAAGDAIIIQGQSNAEARMLSGSSSAYLDSFIRVYGSGNDNWWPTPQWHIGQGDGARNTDGNTGQWGLVLAKRIIQESNYPVAIFNGAHGGQPSSFFLPNSADHNDVTTNYGRLLTRIQMAGFQNHVRAVFWYQGEASAGGAEPDDIASYKSKFYTILNAWKSDYLGLERIYLCQIRLGCAQDPDRTLLIKEALRQIALENITDTRIYGTGALQHIDGCHFYFANGYEKLGLDMSSKLLHDLYGKTDEANSESPIVISCVKVGATQVKLNLKTAGDIIVIEPGALDDIHFEGVSTQPVIQSADIIGNAILLNLDFFPTGATGLTYAEEHVGASAPNIANNNNMAMVNFYNLEIGIGLPVTISFFTAERSGEGTALLQWRTEQETEMQGFYIQHSTDGIDFKTAGFVAAGNRSGTHQYQFQHKLARNQINYYRLKMNHHSGEITYSSIVMVRAEITKELELWFPTYSSGAASGNLIVLSPQNEEASISIHNQLGQLMGCIRTRLVTGTNVVALDNYISRLTGIFYVAVYAGGNKKTIKISKPR